MRHPLRFVSLHPFAGCSLFPTYCVVIVFTEGNRLRTKKPCRYKLSGMYFPKKGKRWWKLCFNLFSQKYFHEFPSQTLTHSHSLPPALGYDLCFTFISPDLTLSRIYHLVSVFSLLFIRKRLVRFHDKLSNICSSRKETELAERQSLAQRFSCGNAHEWSLFRRSRQAQLFNAFDISTFSVTNFAFLVRTEESKK